MNRSKNYKILQNITKSLHKKLAHYGYLEGDNKANFIAGILLALNNNLDVTESLNGLTDFGAKDGDVIFNQIEDLLGNQITVPSGANNLSEQVNVIFLSKFRFIKENVVLNSINEDLGVTPIRYFTDVLKEYVLPHFKINTDLDILGNFYGTSIKYGRNKTNNLLRIILTS